MRRVYKNLCPATIIASIMVANMWKNSLKNVESDSNNILYKTLQDFFLQRNGIYFLNKPCTYIHTYIHTYIYIFQRSLRLSPDNRMWNMLIFLNKEQRRITNRIHIYEIKCYKLDEQILCKQQFTV